MSFTTADKQRGPIAIPLAEIAPWAIFGGLMMFIIIYFVGAEQGALSIFSRVSFTLKSQSSPWNLGS